MLEINKIHQGNCLKLMKEIIEGSVDMILCDLPYGLTNNEWDKQLNLDILFFEYWRVLKSDGCIILTAQQPYVTQLINHQLKYFRYDLIWKKGERASGFLNANKMPLRNHEHILIFYKKLPTYNPQFRKGKPTHKKGKPEKETNNNYGTYKTVPTRDYGEDKFPLSVIDFERPHPPIHPTQKPVELFRYLIRTFSNEGDLVLDNCVGSGTTAEASKQLNRNFIGIELDHKYVDIANKRLQQEVLI